MTIDGPGWIGRSRSDYVYTYAPPICVEPNTFKKKMSVSERNCESLNVDYSQLDDQKQTIQVQKFYRVSSDSTKVLTFATTKTVF
jgi:hypothetical protein